MAKVTMMCPLSGKKCRDCAIYRGRHYFLCFCGDYRGRVEDPGEPTKTSQSLSPQMRSSRRFEMPIVSIVRTHDPFAPAGKRERKADPPC